MRTSRPSRNPPLYPSPCRRPWAAQVAETLANEARSEFELSSSDISATNIDAIIGALDGATTQLLDSIMPRFYESLERITAATGNVVDGSGKTFFESFCEMLETVELTFDNDGKISDGFTLITNPSTAENIARAQAS